MTDENGRTCEKHAHALLPLVCTMHCVNVMSHDLNALCCVLVGRQMLISACK
jgi:hypothetical protein